MNNLYKPDEFGERPWGNWKCVSVGDGFIVKIITVNSHQSLSLQMHNFRSEHWFIIKGKPTITISDITKEYFQGQSVDIPAKTKHRLENLTNDILEIIEIQMGDILDEKDITRFEDAYNRV